MTGISALRNARNARRRAARRAARPGYPVAPGAFTLAQVRAYFEGDCIVCLVCGKSYRQIGQHLTQTHKLEIDAYKTAYGLPWRRGLTCDATAKRHSNAALAVIEAGYDPTTNFDLEKMQRAPHRKRQNYRTELSLLNIVGADHPVRWGADDFKRFVEKMRSAQLAAVEVANLEGFPRLSWVRAWCRAHADAEAAYCTAWEALPFTVQAQAERLGERFATAVRTLYDVGLSDHKIAAKLGVTAMTVNARTRLLRRVKRS